MQADHGIRDEIDRSFGEGPHGVPVDDLLTQGHRALARRRLLTGTGAALAVVVICGTAAVAAGGPGTHASPAPGYAVRPSASPTAPAGSVAPALRTPGRREVNKALTRPLVEYTDTGRLVVVPEATVVRRVDNIYPQLPGRSVALELDYRRARYWYTLYQAPDLSTSGSCLWSGSYKGDFDAWLAEEIKNPPQVTMGDPPPGGSSGDWPGIPNLDVVRFVGSTERLEPVAGVTILEQQAHVSVGESFAGPVDQTAAAKVEAADGTRYYVLARRVAGDTPHYIAVLASVGGPTLADFLDFARVRYADNGGGLL